MCLWLWYELHSLWLFFVTDCMFLSQISNQHIYCSNLDRILYFATSKINLFIRIHQHIICIFTVVFERVAWKNRGISRLQVRRFELTAWFFPWSGRLNVFSGTWKRISLPSDIRLDTWAHYLEMSPFHRIVLHTLTFTFTEWTCQSRRAIVMCCRSRVWRNPLCSELPGKLAEDSSGTTIAGRRTTVCHRQNGDRHRRRRHWCRLHRHCAQTGHCSLVKLYVSLCKLHVLLSCKFDVLLCKFLSYANCVY